MARPKQKRPVEKLNREQLEAETKKYDKPLPPEEMQPLSKAEQERFERFQKTARERNKRKKTAILIAYVDRELLKQADAYANKHGMERSELIERSLRSALTFVK